VKSRLSPISGLPSANFVSVVVWSSLTWRFLLMKLPRNIPLFRSFKFAPFAVIAVFLFTNVTGIMFSRVLAPIAKASSADTSAIPADIPTSGNKDLDLIIFQAGEREGVDPRFIHAVIWQESKYDTSAHSHAGALGLMQLMPDTAKRFGCSDP